MKRNGSALILVLGLVAVLAVLVLGFGRLLRSDLKAASMFYEEAINTQLSRSAYTLALREMGRASGPPFSDRFGNLYFVSNPESYDDEIEELSVYREGLEFGRGMISYRFVQKPFALDPNELSAPQWDRLLEVACEMDSETDRAVIADSILDWIDSDSNAREDGFEEEDYQSMDPPRHCRNNSLWTTEELLLVNGMTPELFYGYGLPVREEDGILFGGGLVRFLVGDNSPEAETAVQYILNGVLPSEDLVDDEDEDSDVFQAVESLPKTVYLIAQGFVPDAAALDVEADVYDPFDEQEHPEAGLPFVSRHILLAVFELPKDGSTAEEYFLADIQENAAGGLPDAVLAYGVPEED